MNTQIVFAMVRLRLNRLVKDRAGLFWFLIMPIVFSLLMANLLGDWSTGSGGDNRPRLLVYCSDQDEAIASFLEPLQDNDFFRLVRVDSLVAQEEAKAVVKSQRITAALFIPPNLGQTMELGHPNSMQLYYDSDRHSSQTIRTLLDRAILRINTESAAANLARTDSLAAFDSAVFAELWENPRVVLQAETIGRKAESGLELTQAAQHTGPAYTIFFMMMFLMMGAKDLVAEREDRTLARLKASRASALDLVLGFFLGGFLMAIIQAALLLGINSLALGIDYGDSPAALVLVVLLFGGVASSSSILLGSVARTGAQADGLGMAMTLILAALGGLWWPLEITPEFMQSIGHALPTGQAITIFHDMIGRGWGVAEVSSLLLGLAIWFVTLIVLATWRLRKVVAV